MNIALSFSPGRFCWGGVGGGVKVRDCDDGKR